jgi:phosphoglycerate dehydrogenase-like enzyme
MTGKTRVLVTHYEGNEHHLSQIAAVDPRIEVEAAIYLDDMQRKLIEANRTPEEKDAPMPDGAPFFRKVGATEVLFSLYLPDNIRELAPELKWVHVYGAGIDPLKKTGLLENGIILTNSSGLNAPFIGETVITYMLMHVKNMLFRLANQKAIQWKRSLNDTLEGKTLGIVGPGHIGSETARRAAAFGMRILATRRSFKLGEQLPNIEQTYPMSQLGEMLPQCDFVLASVNLTPETTRLFGVREFALMKKGAYFMNVARGPVVDHPALVSALRSGHLGGAGLDVFDPEPLPADSPLWSMPNVIITPHNAAFFVRQADKSTSLFCENLRRYLKGEPLLNLITPDKGY